MNTTTLKKCLIVVDYQNDFVTGPLGYRGAEDLDERIAAKIKEYHDRGDDVIFTLDTHENDYLDTYEGHLLPTPHCPVVIDATCTGAADKEMTEKAFDVMETCHITIMNRAK